MDKDYAVDTPEIGPGFGGTMLRKGLVNPNLRRKLELKKEMLEQQLDNVNNAIKTLDENPNIEKVIDILAKA